MKLPNLLLAIAAFALLPAAMNGPSIQSKSEARLADLLNGRVAGKPVDCITVPDGDRLVTYEYVGLVYRNRGTIYVSRVADPQSLKRGYAPVTEVVGRTICAHDIGQAADLDGGLVSDVRFGPFVPYTKPARRP